MTNRPSRWRRPPSFYKDNEDEEMVDVAVELEDVGNAEAVEIVVRAPEPDDCTLPMEVDDYKPQGTAAPSASRLAAPRM